MMNPCLLKNGIQPSFFARFSPNPLTYDSPIMKKLMILIASLALTLPLMAGEKKTVTLEGTGMCAKCSLSKTDSCTNALQVKGKDGKVLTYLFTENMAHGKYFCQGKTENLLVTGVVKKEDGKLMIVPSAVKEKES